LNTLKASLLEQGLHQDRIAHDGERQSESQDDSNLSFEPVDPSLSVVGPDRKFRNGINPPSSQSLDP
jgi:hypothetical protein